MTAKNEQRQEQQQQRQVPIRRFWLRQNDEVKQATTKAKCGDSSLRSE
jgi:hypothetical protein